MTSLIWLARARPLLRGPLEKEEATSEQELEAMVAKRLWGKSRRPKLPQEWAAEAPRWPHKTHQDAPDASGTVQWTSEIGQHNRKPLLEGPLYRLMIVQHLTCSTVVYHLAVSVCAGLLKPDRCSKKTK